MSQARRLAREERERAAAQAAAARAAQEARARRRTARWSRVSGPVARLLASSGSQPTGALAERRRGEVRATIAMLVALNVLVWVFDADWSARALVLALSLLAAPVLHTILFKRS